MEGAVLPGYLMYVHAKRDQIVVATIYYLPLVKFLTAYINSPEQSP